MIGFRRFRYFIIRIYDYTSKYVSLVNIDPDEEGEEMSLDEFMFDKGSARQGGHVG